MLDQSIKKDAGKPRITLVPMEIVTAIARVREKYMNTPGAGEHLWKQVDVGRFLDALGRHYVDFHKNPAAIDAESGQPTIWHIATNVAFIISRYDELTAKKCIVAGCNNYSNEGKFIGDLCAPCYYYLTTGCYK